MKNRIEIYADEQFNENFVCIGNLFVPIDKKDMLIKYLLDMRCLYEKSKEWHWKYEDCRFIRGCKKQWHDLNNSKIHYVELDSAGHALKKISKNWLNFLIEQTKKEDNQIRFNLLYINLDNLDITKFGSEKEHENIYNKFFRTCLIYGSKSFFENNKVSIKKVYHHKANVERHKYFPYLNLRKIEKINNERISVEDYSIKFLELDHKKEDNFKGECQLIQFIDLIIGLTTQNIFNLSNDHIKKEHAMVIRPLVEQLLKSPTIKDRSFHCYGRQNISFFPKYKSENAKATLINLNEDISERFRDLFYKPTKLKMPYYHPKQMKLEII